MGLLMCCIIHCEAETLNTYPCCFIYDVVICGLHNTLLHSFEMASSKNLEQEENVRS